MTRLAFAAAVGATLLLVAAPVRAEPDGRLHTVRYDAETVVQLRGQRGYQSMIRFAANERIENVAVGDSAAWQVTPNKRADMLFLKPMLPDARTNMTVVTDKRTYMFDLLTAPARARPVYALSFSYPDEPQAPAPAIAAAQETVLAEAPPAAPPALRLNHAWAAKGHAAVLPASIHDDGVTTYLAWPDKALLPAILTPGADGMEAPVNFAVRDGVIQIDQVHPVLILRSGASHATLIRAAPAAGPETAAASPPTRIAERAR